MYKADYDGISGLPESRDLKPIQNALLEVVHCKAATLMWKTWFCEFLASNGTFGPRVLERAHKVVYDREIARAVEAIQARGTKHADICRCGR